MSLTPEWDKIIELEEIVERQLEALVDLVNIVEDDHYKCDIDSDEKCDLLEDGEWQIAYHHGAIRQAKQAIAKSKGGE